MLLLLSRIASSKNLPNSRQVQKPYPIGKTIPYLTKRLKSHPLGGKDRHLPPHNERRISIWRASTRPKKK